MFKLVLLFTVTPLIELGILIKLSHYIGVFPSVGIVAVTGFIGAFLANQQKTKVVKKIRSSLEEGIMPADNLIDGLLILIGGILLITPGLLTDISGFLCILPSTRPKVKALTKGRFKKLITSGKFQFSAHNSDETQKVDVGFDDDSSCQ